MVLAAADLDSNQLSPVNSAGAGLDMTTLFLCLAFLILGSLALPMALRHVPAATEHAATAASQISGPGRMTYMGSRVAGTAKMMRSGGNRALVEAGAATGPLGAVAAAGTGAVTGAATAATAAGGAADRTAGNDENSDPGPSPSPGGTGPSGTPQSPHPGGSTTSSAPGTRGTDGATKGGTPTSRGVTARNGQPGQGAEHPSEGPPPSGSGHPGTSGNPGGVEGAASRASRAPGAPTPKDEGGSHG